MDAQVPKPSGLVHLIARLGPGLVLDDEIAGKPCIDIPESRLVEIERGVGGASHRDEFVCAGI